jgi:hypothetical protein
MNDINLINEAVVNCIKSGMLDYDWVLFKEYIKKKLREIDNDDEMIGYIFRDLDRIEKVPFTIQRICEMIHEPPKYYKNTKKFLFSFHKLVNLDF